MEIDPAQTNIGLQFVIIGILILVNAYFAASEMAIVSINKTKIRHLAEQGDKKAKIVEKLLNEPTSFLSTIQVAITLAGFFNSASAATGLSKEFAGVLMQWNIPFGESLAMIVITILLSFVTLILGELVPKRVALQKAESIAMVCAGPILFISKVLSPFIKLLSFFTGLVLRLLGMKDENIEESLSREEIKMMVESGQEKGVFNETETEMINSIFEFDDILAMHVMTPRPDVFCIDIDDPIEDFLEELMEMHYTRIPVYEESIDNIIGILHIKDYVVEAYKVGFKNVDIRKCLRKAYFVLETKNIDELFKDMQKRHQHIAILVDEYGGFSGIATTEDLIEEIMGEISDEYDEFDNPSIQMINSATYLIDGNLSLDDINEELMIHLESENHETLSGLVLDLLGEIPESGQHKSVEMNDFRFKVIEVKDKRLSKIELTILSDHVLKNGDKKQ